MLVVIRGERQYIYKGKKFYVHTATNGELKLTNMSVMKKQVRHILAEWLEEGEIEVCLKRFKGSNSINDSATEFETIIVEGSRSECYASLMKHKPETEPEKEFKKNLKTAIDADVESFRVPVNDPSFDCDYRIHFAPNCNPAVGYPYRELERIGNENGVRLGTKDEYCLFLGTIILRLIGQGWSMTKSWMAICNDSKELGNYWDSKEAKHRLELTGSREIVGKCDLANTCKILAKDEWTGAYWIAGGDYLYHGSYSPIATLRENYDVQTFYGVGWYVLSCTDR